jgi:hypothetical protein
LPGADVGAPHPVPTGGGKTVVPTGIGVHLVAVITAFIPLSTRLQVLAPDRVTTDGCCAGVAATVPVVEVAVITGLPFTDYPVAAGPGATEVIAAIILNLVAVIASLIAIGPRP